MPRSFDELERLKRLSECRANENRRLLAENMSDLFLSEEERFSDRERALIVDILTKLVNEAEMAVRRRLAQRLADQEEAPHELATLLANDSIEVARPLLIKSRVLRDPDLIDIVHQRGREHRLVVAQREGLTEAVSDALIDFGEEDVIATLIENGDAEISRTAMDYLVAESRRVDRFQEPLLARSDMPPELAQRMFWWVSAALRRHIMQHFDIDSDHLDDNLEAATHEDIRAGEEAKTEAEKLAEMLDKRQELNERFLIQTMRNNQLSIFIAGLARLAGLDVATTRRIVLDRQGESLAVACKGAGFDRSTFASLFLLTRGAHERTARSAIQPGAVETILKFFDGLSEEKAKSALRYWARDSRYLDAIRDVND